MKQIQLLPDRMYYVPLFAKTPVFGRLIGIGTLCQFKFDRVERPLETLDDADGLSWIADALVLL